MSELAELLDRFAAGSAVLGAALTGVIEPEIDFKPSPAEWSVRQIMAHMADSEMVATYRFRRVIAEENATFEGYDQDAWAEKLDYAVRDVRDSLDVFRAAREFNYALFRTLPEPAFERVGIHAQRGPMKLFDLLKIYAVHAEKHARQIGRVRDAYRASGAAA